ncbi:hypothetical protein [Streptomyces sp. NPDC019224]|uniref:hypothetical protein n=1 Tax=Streptomyces sp. NPDC019224 TaxID=3154484 RepID=UPI00340E36AC
MTTSSALPKSGQQLIIAVRMVGSILIRLGNAGLSTAPETFADPVRGLDAGPGRSGHRPGPEDGPAGPWTCRHRFPDDPVG